MSELPEAPQSRVEEWLAVIAGMEGVEPEPPQSRVEKWLAYIAEHGGGGSGGGTAADVTYDNAESGLTAEDVQGAIDELADGKIDKAAQAAKTAGMTQAVGIDENGKLWTVPGGGGSGGTAADVTYDNTGSGLDADNVQTAVDELADVVGDVAAEVGDAVSYDAQSKAEAQKDQARANIGAAAKEPHPYAYDGVNLKELFGDGDAPHTALQAEDYSHIHNGDYYPITFNGAYRDYGEWVAPAGAKCYSDTALKTEAGTLDADTVTTYVDASPAYYNITISGTTYHVKMQDCQRWREKTINQTALAEANINVYYQYGDSGVLSGKKPHIMWLARDGIGNFKMRSTNLQWADAVEQIETGDGSTSVFSTEDATLKCVRYVCVDGALMKYNTAYTVNTSTGAVTFKSGYIPADGADIIISRTTHDCPWVGSAIFRTLNDPDYGLMRLITDTAFAAHILGGEGMRYAGEMRTVAGSTDARWFSRGKGFLPTESEVWGTEVFSTRGNWSNLPQLPIFANGGRRHLMKGSTNGASRFNWWEGSSSAETTFCDVRINGNADSNSARSANALALGFVTY